MEIFDSHTHINSHEFDNDISDIIERAKTLDVTKMLVIWYDDDSRKKLQEIIQEYPHIYGAVGCHPEDALNYNAEYKQELRKYLELEKFVAVGEIGLDYYHDSPKKVQHEVFEKQIALAQELKLPISVHNRDAFEDCYAILKNMNIQKNGGIMHSFNGDTTWAEKFLDLGMELSYSGVVTFKSAKEVQESMMMTPLEHMLVETDAPYLAPVPKRGRENRTAYTRYVVDKIAELRGLMSAEVAQAPYENALRIFNLKED